MDRIKAGRLQKVVLARDLYASAPGLIDERLLLDRLADRYPDCYTFACGGLVGATPELLIRRQGLQISSLVLAGTAPRGDDPAGTRRSAPHCSPRPRTLRSTAMRPPGCANPWPRSVTS